MQRPTILPKDEAFAGITGAFPRTQKGKPPNWKQKLMGSLVEGEDGIWRPAPQKERGPGGIQAQFDEYLRRRNTMNVRMPDGLMRALFAFGGLLDRLVEGMPNATRDEWRMRVRVFRKQAKAALANHPDNLLLDPRPMPDGSRRCLQVEIKTAAGKLSRGQKAASEARGGYLVVRSIEEAIAVEQAFLSAPIPSGRTP